MPKTQVRKLKIQSRISTTSELNATARGMKSRVQTYARKVRKGV